MAQGLTPPGDSASYENPKVPADNQSDLFEAGAKEDLSSVASAKAEYNFQIMLVRLGVLGCRFLVSLTTDN